MRGAECLVISNLALIMDICLNLFVMSQHRLHQNEEHEAVRAFGSSSFYCRQLIRGDDDRTSYIVRGLSFS